MQITIYFPPPHSKSGTDKIKDARISYNFAEKLCNETSQSKFRFFILITKKKKKLNRNDFLISFRNIFHLLII